jgi:hypothetical protein
MPERLSGPSRREARIVTTGCAGLAGVGFASGVSPAIETAAGWVFGAVFAVGGLWLLVRIGRSVWLALAIDREASRSLHDNARMVREVHRDA